MSATFTTTVLKDGEKSATGLQVPPEIVAGLGKGKKPPAKVNLNGYTYRTTVAVMGGVFMLSLSAENREAAGVQAGETVQVTLELDTEPRTVTIPDDLAAALAQTPGAASAFDALSYSVRKEYVRQHDSPDAGGGQRLGCPVRAFDHKALRAAELRHPLYNHHLCAPGSRGPFPSLPVGYDYRRRIGNAVAPDKCVSNRGISQ